MVGAPHQCSSSEPKNTEVDWGKEGGDKVAAKAKAKEDTCYSPALC